MIEHEAGPPSRVLVIEDSKADQSVYRRTLHEFDVTFADSGELGLERLASERFDLVVLDFHLPRMNGDEVLARIKSGIPTPRLPVVIVTGGGSEHVAVELLKRGAADYVTKDELHTPRVAARRPGGAGTAPAGAGPPTRPRTSFGGGRTSSNRRSGSSRRPRPSSSRARRWPASASSSRASPTRSTTRSPMSPTTSPCSTATSARWPP